MKHLWQMHVDMKGKEGEMEGKKAETSREREDDVTGLECQHQSAIAVQMVLHNCTSAS